MKLRKLNDIQEDLQNAEIDLINQQIKIVSLQLEENKKLLEENKKLLKTKTIKTTIDKEFFEKWENEDVVMWCKKEEYAKEFCNILDRYGFRWSNEEKYSTKVLWDVCSTNTCYEFNMGYYGHLDGYKEGNCTILDFEDYIIKKKMTKKELVELIIDNFVDEYGRLDLSELDFSDFCGDVFINAMKINGSLYQHSQKVNGFLYEGGHRVNEGIYDFFLRKEVIHG